MHKQSRLPDSSKTFETRVEGRKGVRLEPATGSEHREVIKNIVSVLQTRAIPSYIERVDSERVIGDETEKPDRIQSTQW